MIGEVVVVRAVGLLDQADHRLLVAAVGLGDERDVDHAAADLADVAHRVGDHRPVLLAPEGHVVLGGQRVGRLHQLDPGAVVLRVGHGEVGDLEADGDGERLLALGLDGHLAGVDAGLGVLRRLQRQPDRHHRALAGGRRRERVQRRLQQAVEFRGVVGVVVAVGGGVPERHGVAGPHLRGGDDGGALLQVAARDLQALDGLGRADHHLARDVPVAGPLQVHRPQRPRTGRRSRWCSRRSGCRCSRPGVPWAARRWAPGPPRRPPSVDPPKLAGVPGEFVGTVAVWPARACPRPGSSSRRGSCGRASG